MARYRLQTFADSLDYSFHISQNPSLKCITSQKLICYHCFVATHHNSLAAGCKWKSFPCRILCHWLILKNRSPNFESSLRALFRSQLHGWLIKIWETWEPGILAARVQTFRTFRGQAYQAAVSRSFRLGAWSKFPFLEILLIGKNCAILRTLHAI